ncbi:MAG: 50S ribosomal protein L24e [Nanoarchaeota archaeon]
MVKCVFCGKEEREFRGVHLMKNDGTIAYFCSSKCRKGMINLGRDKRSVKWTESYKIALKKSEAKKEVAREAAAAKTK